MFLATHAGRSDIPMPDDNHRRPTGPTAATQGEIKALVARQQVTLRTAIEGRPPAPRNPLGATSRSGSRTPPRTPHTTCCFLPL